MIGRAILKPRRLIRAPCANIYTKDTDLDTKQYDRKNAEDEELINYYRNYMKDTKMSDEERALYQAKVDKLMATQS